MSLAFGHEAFRRHSEVMKTPIRIKAVPRRLMEQGVSPRVAQAKRSVMMGQR